MKSNSDGAESSIAVKMDGYARRRLRISGQILDAAEELIRESGSTEFSMAEVASRADVSSATPFNHFEQKLGMLKELLLRSIQEVSRQKVPEFVKGDPVQCTIDGAILATKVYTSDPKLYRPLLCALLSTPSREALGLATQLWEPPLYACQEQGLIDPEIDVGSLADTLEVSWYGALSLWAVGMLNTAEFQERVRNSTKLMLIGAGSAPKN